VRVLLAAPSMQVGGAEKLVVSLARELVARGETVAVSGPPGPLDDELPAAVSRLLLPERGRSPAGAVTNAIRLTRLANGFRPDVIHAHNVKVSAMASVASRLIPRRPRPRVITTFHGVVPAEYRAAARLLRGADTVACVSAELLERLVAAGYPRRRALVVHNAVDPATELTTRRRAELAGELGLTGGPVIASVGRLVPEKAQHRLLDATALVVAAVPDLRLLVVGDGPLRAELGDRADALGIANAVTFTGTRGDARDLIALADLLVLTSDSEGLPLAALEALEAGVAVVSTDVPGMHELLGSGAGTIVADFTPAAVAEAIVVGLQSPETRAQQGTAGRRLMAEQHSMAAMLDGYLECYRPR
jgi:glycosyltransferase involved in cell wall biosynthesis